MQLVLRDARGTHTNAVVLSGNTDRLRVVFRGGRDAVELRREGEEWFSEEGEVFEIDACIADGDFQAPLLRAGLCQRTHAA